MNLPIYRVAMCTVLLSCLNGCFCCCQPPGVVRTTAGVADPDPNGKQAGELTVHQTELLVARTAFVDSFGKADEGFSIKSVFMRKDESGDHTYVGEATEWDGTVWEVTMIQDKDSNSLSYEMDSSKGHRGKTFIGTIDTD